MFSKSDTTYKSQTGGYRKYVYAAIGATAALLGGAAIFGDVQNTEESFSVEAGEHFVNFLSDHRDFFVNQHNVVTELIEEGQMRQVETMEAILELN